MRINFIGNYQNGYVGEVSDESHLARELENLGHTVIKVPRDQWKALCDGESAQDDWVLPEKADINIIAKWHHFNDEKYVKALKIVSSAPVFYWVWDFMLDPKFPEWHLKMAQSADLYLSGELGLATHYRNNGVRFYYFQMDVCDGTIPVGKGQDKVHDVIFTGSYLGQGDRIEYLTKIKEVLGDKLEIFSWNYEEWEKRGFNASPAVYGIDYNVVVSQSKIVLGLSVEPHCFGYWSNRVGKVITAGGFLLQQYAPGMEQFLPHEGVDFFSSPEEAIKKIKAYLDIDYWAEYSRDKYKFTSSAKAEQLTILMERYLLENKGEKWLLP
jgi:hypothetical protein